ncbi:HNH endonuclease signature motif containing protein [Paraburkholderia sp. Cpub6]|uniref:HNH endonuclease signature motif containing protein n=1 Tax=Paraburkholderia sp. Cpub6 TaxID=2723094 RepID=UPI0016138354|nr:HNH endonuclease signature motif containing protein [Paraburkholderia sp. Cpub6]MBB5462900.1 hypothetical protein [Paraburkholderia sp. Cpub6]
MSTECVKASLSRHQVDADTGCWNWMGSKCKDGYGKVNLKIGGKRFSLAHRASYFLHKGVIPAGLEIDHECKNRGCVNPEHLRAVTHAINVDAADYTVNHRNARKTHCHKGHELSPDNVIQEKSRTGIARKCRQCKRDREASKRHLMAARGITIKEVK